MAIRIHKVSLSIAVPIRTARLRRLASRVLLYALLSLGALAVLIPLLWSLSTALKTTRQTLAYPPEWIPQPIVWSNFVDALTAKPFHIYYLNSLIVAGLR